MTSTTSLHARDVTRFLTRAHFTRSTSPPGTTRGQRHTTSGFHTTQADGNTVVVHYIPFSLDTRTTELRTHEHTQMLNTYTDYLTRRYHVTRVGDGLTAHLIITPKDTP